MLQPYHDIVGKLGRPEWWDEAGVPRYVPFQPGEAHDIYADEVALVEIACQNCGKRFLVAFSTSAMRRLWPAENGEPLPTLADAIKTRGLHYGDPPCWFNANCIAGSTMNCEDIRVVEFWKTVNLEWERVPELEIDLPAPCPKEV